MKRRRTLITSPLEWQMSAAPVPPPMIPVLPERGGTQLNAPRAVALIDTREQNPFHFTRFKGWFAGVERRALQLGDYSIAGLEDVCVVERKELADLVHSFTTERATFLNRLRRMAKFPIASWSSPARSARSSRHILILSYTPTKSRNPW